MIKDCEYEDIDLIAGMGALNLILFGIFNLGFGYHENILCGLTFLIILFLERAYASYIESKTNIMLLNILASILTAAISVIFLFN